MEGDNHMKVLIDGSFQEEMKVYAQRRQKNYLFSSNNLC